MARKAKTAKKAKKAETAEARRARWAREAQAARDLRKQSTAEGLTARLAWLQRDGIRKRMAPALHARKVAECRAALAAQRGRQGPARAKAEVRA